MIKKTCLSLLMAILLCCPVISAVGNTTYYIPEGDISLDIPDNYVVLTRDIEEDDLILEAFGLSKEEAISKLEEADLDLDAFDLTGTFDICVSINDLDSGGLDFNDYSDSELLEVYDVESLNASSGYAEITSVEVYDQGIMKFVRVYSTQDYGSVKAGLIEYITACNNKIYEISLYSYSGQVNSAQESTLKNIVDSISFGKRTSNEQYLANQGEFKYIDSEIGLSFTVPDYWTEKTITANTGDLVAKFQWSIDPNALILYGRIQLDDKTIDTSYYTVDFLADSLGVSSDQIRIVEYGGKEYRGGPSSTSIDLEGEVYTVEALYLVHIENGWMYFFHFVGDEYGAEFADFESLMNSIKYPGAANDSQTGVAENQSDTSVSSDDGDDVVVIIAVCVVAVLVVIVVMLKRKNSNGKTDATLTASGSPTTENHTPECNRMEQKRSYCYNCGAQLRNDSVFCEQCGAKIVTDQNKCFSSGEENKP